ncbi:prolyl 4-hydroxylase alpha-subunit [Fragilaria crotonensis]|nr:prolyl 4-hydroxylase alpha-subunit [Fragilaria crotonensis]
MHCGKLLHGADRVTRGHRTVLVGFVDVADWAICDGVERRACTTFGRMDVAERRAQLQLQQLLKLSKLTQEESAPSNNHHDINNHDNGRPRLHRGWSARRSTRFLPKTSCFNRIIPAFDTALQRADPEFQRKTRLQAEDLLLRTILVEEKSEFLQRILSSGDVSVL